MDASALRRQPGGAGVPPRPGGPVLSAGWAATTLLAAAAVLAADGWLPAAVRLLVTPVALWAPGSAVLVLVRRGRPAPAGSNGPLLAVPLSLAAIAAVGLAATAVGVAMTAASLGVGLAVVCALGAVTALAGPGGWSLRGWRAASASVAAVGLTVAALGGVVAAVHAARPPRTGGRFLAVGVAVAHRRPPHGTRTGELPALVVSVAGRSAGAVRVQVRVDDEARLDRVISTLPGRGARFVLRVPAASCLQVVASARSLRGDQHVAEQTAVWSGGGPGPPGAGGAGGCRAPGHG